MEIYLTHTLLKCIKTSQQHECFLLSVGLVLKIFPVDCTIQPTLGAEVSSVFCITFTFKNSHPCKSWKSVEKKDKGYFNRTVFCSFYRASIYHVKYKIILWKNEPLRNWLSWGEFCIWRRLKRRIWRYSLFFPLKKFTHPHAYIFIVILTDVLLSDTGRLNNVCI